jgi:hypothetical protein
VKAGTFTADHAAKLALKDGFVEITGLTPGDFSLRLRGDERDFTIQVSEGKQIAGWLLGKHRNLELKNTAPLQITGVTTDKDVVAIKLANATVFTRVHIAASRFEPGKGIFAGLGGFARFGVASGTPAARSATNTATSSNAAMANSIRATCSPAPACSSIRGKSATPASTNYHSRRCNKPA